ncbi:hypothetical protein GGR56DRAFT_306456 [Xylariaceae sp. FL0804]|nr:hypothetical protein GGR56DRAFT_306456 [Xylariaceae sp. FL0804]
MRFVADHRAEPTLCLQALVITVLRCLPAHTLAPWPAHHRNKRYTVWWLQESWPLDVVYAVGRYYFCFLTERTCSAVPPHPISDMCFGYSHGGFESGQEAQFFLPP